MSAHEGSKWQEEREARACPMHKVYDNNCSFCRDIREEAKPKPTPVESERDWEEDFSHENGNYQNQCNTCGLLFYGHKRRVQCKECVTSQVKALTGILKGAAPKSEPSPVKGDKLALAEKLIKSLKLVFGYNEPANKGAFQLTGDVNEIIEAMKAYDECLPLESESQEELWNELKEVHFSQWKSKFTIQRRK